MRFSVFLLCALLCVGVAAPARASSQGLIAQENPNRPTASQPDAGVKISDRPFDRPWSYTWVARPLIALVAVFLLALALGFLVRWIGLGRRTT